MRRMGVKFCGGCNPQIERTRFVDELKKKLPEDLCLTHSDNTEKWELGIMVCGCRWPAQTDRQHETFRSNGSS